MPRYDVPKLADYSGVLNANNSMIQAFSNLGKQSQDYLNYDMNKKQNEWEKAFKMDDFINKDKIDTRDYNYKVQRDGVADKQTIWDNAFKEKELEGINKYRDQNLAIQRQAVSNKGGMNPLDLMKMNKMEQDMYNQNVDRLVNNKNFQQAPKHIQTRALEIVARTGQNVLLDYNDRWWDWIPFVDKETNLILNPQQQAIANQQQTKANKNLGKLANKLANLNNKQIIDNHNNKYFE